MELISGDKPGMTAARPTAAAAVPPLNLARPPQPPVSALTPRDPGEGPPSHRFVHSDSGDEEADTATVCRCFTLNPTHTAYCN